MTACFFFHKNDIIREFSRPKKFGISDEVKTLEKRYAEVFKEAKNRVDNSDAVEYNRGKSQYAYNSPVSIGGYTYTWRDYTRYGWARAHNVISAGYWRNFTENFAQAVDGNYKYPKTKYGEFMIEIYDAYGNSEIADVIVFASGSIEVPKVTQVIKIDTTDPDEIEYERRDILEAGRRGIQQTAGEFFRFYYKTDSIGELVNEGTGTQKNRDSGGLNIKRRGSEIKTDPIVESWRHGNGAGCPCIFYKTY